ncbi:cobalamin biosynthesis protein [uncultured Rhodoblastus sp.]|uniref:cobalamin biosynthesis protein n=1 Tax=uncultured Rhodoblastus sp. TaxID=543037 RepID=UPI0025E87E8A|nr:cobalamin biosynthesis protein [uncultured Rhodoblastus sp.]
MLSEIAIGVGCRKGASAQSIAALAREILADAPAFSRAKIFTIGRKSDEPGLHEAAGALGLPLVFLDEAEFLARQGEFLLRGASASPRSQALTGLASVAEAAALMGGGHEARLILRRRAAHGVTAAIAANGDTA